MKKFLLKIIIFISLALIIILSVSLITFLQTQNASSKIKIDNNIHTIICGDSHTQTAINDSMFAGSLNISQSSQHYFYLYNVLKKLLKSNPHIKNVIVGYSYHSLSSYYDNYLFEEKNSKHMYTRYFPILDFNSIFFLTTKNFKGVADDFNNIFKSINKNTKVRDLERYQFIGKFYDSDRTNKNDSTIMNAVNYHFYTDKIAQDFSEYQEIYLEKIIDLCKKQNIKLLLINCPLSPEYKAKIPSKFIENYYSFSSQYKNIILDLSDFPLPENCYGDGDHINRSGSILFTKELITRLNSNNYNSH